MDTPQKPYTEASESRKGWAKDAVMLNSLSQARDCALCKYKIFAGQPAIKEGGKFRHIDCEISKREAAQREKEEKKAQVEEKRKKIEEKKKAAAEKKAAREARKKERAAAGTGKTRRPRVKKEEPKDATVSA